MGLPNQNPTIFIFSTQHIMKIKLKIADRYSLMRVLPIQKTNFTTLSLCKEIKEIVAITKKEKLEYKLVELPNGRVKWDLSLTKNEKEFTFSETQKNVIKTELKKLNDDNEMDETLINIYQLFVLD